MAKKEAFIRCKASPGMFSDESVIEVDRRRGGSEFFIVPSSAIVQRNGDSFVRASVVERDNVKWAILPTEYSDSVAVDDSAVEMQQ